MLHTSSRRGTNSSCSATPSTIRGSKKALDPGDKLNAMLSVVGFNLVKLLKGLKERWLKYLFLCLRKMAEGMARIITGLRE
jgi:hypothetical protein